MPVNIHGKEYHTVAERVSAFRSKAADLTIETEIVRWEGDDVVVKASISDNGKLIACVRIPRRHIIMQYIIRLTLLIFAIVYFHDVYSSIVFVVQ